MTGVFHSNMLDVVLDCLVCTGTCVALDVFVISHIMSLWGLEEHGVCFFQSPGGNPCATHVPVQCSVC